MASKLRRVPLFGIDSGFSIISSSKKQKAPSPVKGKGVFKMDCEVTTNYPNGSSTANGSSPGGRTNSSNTTSGSRNSSGNGNGSTKSQLHVDFIEGNGEVKEKREKYLTAKYGSHQMNLIRKRLAVEMWLYDEIQKLFEEDSSASGAAKPKSPFSTPEVEIDLDEVLDLDGDIERRKFIKSLLTDVNKSPEVVNKFIDDVLEKAGTL